MSSSLLFSDYNIELDNLDILQLGKKLKSYFRFKENRDQFNTLPKPRQISEILKMYDQQDYILKDDQKATVISKGLKEISPDFVFRKSHQKISKNQVLEHDEYIGTYHALKAVIELSKSLEVPHTDEIDAIKMYRTFKDFFKQCELLFDFKSASLITYKHPVLKEIDRKINGLEKEIRSKLAQISSRWSAEELLQQNNYDVFDDKFVLPVRSDRFSSKFGRIIHRSKGGGVLYVEPFPIRELTNSLEETKANLEREIFKLLKNLCDDLYPHSEDINSYFYYLLSLDHLKGRFNSAQEIGLSKPQFNDEKRFHFQQIFHPLIEDPIKNDLNLEDKQGMLISGPNTGGKTVLLKSICLSLLLPHYGLYIPASDADIYLTDDFYFMSHDNQSLSDGLSSFSSEAHTYLEAMKSLKENAVLFIDEIFNTTSSYEASLLACALIRYAKTRGAITFISSHHETLKEQVFHEKLLESAHMGFRKGTSTPTYMLHQGTPGRSFAREVFRKIENDLMGEPLISDFIVSSDESSQAYGEAIQGIDELKEIARSQIDKNKELEKEIKLEKAKIQSLLNLEKQKLEEEFEQKWNSLKKETLDLAEKIKRGEVKNVIKVTETLNKAKSQKSNKQKNPQEKVLDDTPKVGERVFISALGVSGEVKKLKGTKAFVEAGKIKSWVEFRDLRQANQVKKKQKEQIHVAVQKDQSGRNMKLDARGMRREEFMKRAEEHILDVLNGDLPFVDVVHGHGDGILKKSLYDMLKRYKDDLRYDFIEGNMGTTRVELA